MAQPAPYLSDDRLNRLSDNDAFWGPALSFRPEKARRFGVSRVALLAVLFGGFYGLLLSLAIALICRAIGRSPPLLYAAPSVLTFLTFVGLEFSLRPAWNRRVRLLVRREVYIRSVEPRRGVR
ncbi:MAG TPA: hypothetical protein VIK01_03535 [Polyangiaceae bacterium]